MARLRAASMPWRIMSWWTSAMSQSDTLRLAASIVESGSAELFEDSCSISIREGNQTPRENRPCRNQTPRRGGTRLHGTSGAPVGMSGIAAAQGARCGGHDGSLFLLG